MIRFYFDYVSSNAYLAWTQLPTLAEKYGAKKGSIADIFMPKIIADNLFKWTPFLFAGELVLVGVRYFGA